MPSVGSLETPMFDKKKSPSVRGKCSECRANRVIVASGPHGKFCLPCYTKLERTWADRMSGPARVEQAPAELSDDGLVPAQKSAKNKISS